MKHLNENQTNHKRLFIAVDVSDIVKHEAMRLQKLLQQADLLEGRYLQPEHMHLTLQFLGDINEEVVPKINAALAAIQFPKIAARVGNVDVFSSGKLIKVIFLHIICPQLRELADTLGTRLADFFKPEDRGFTAHLTLARVKKIPDNSALIEFINQLRPEPLSFDIDQFVLRQSTLVNEKRVHTTLHTYPLI